MTEANEQRTQIDPKTLKRLDDLRESLLKEKTREGELEFWEVVLGLPEWIFICSMEQAKASIEQGTGPGMMTLRDGESRMAPMFSTGDRAHKAANHWITDGDQPSAYAQLNTPMPGALAQICSMHPFVANLMVDFVPHFCDGYGTGIEALPGMYDYFYGPPPLGCLPQLSSEAARSQHPRAYLSAYRVIAVQPKLWAVKAANGRIALTDNPDGLVLPFFTSQKHAEALAADQEGARVVDFAPRHLLAAHEKIKSQLGDRYSHAVADITTAPVPIRPDWFQTALESKDKPQSQVGAN